jgi:hypothetical protein
MGLIRFIRETWEMEETSPYFFCDEKRNRIHALTVGGLTLLAIPLMVASCCYQSENAVDSGSLLDNATNSYVGARSQENLRYYHKTN